MCRLFAFILDLHAAKTLTMMYCAAFGCKHESAKRRVVFVFDFLCSPGVLGLNQNVDNKKLILAPQTPGSVWSNILKFSKNPP